MIKLFLVLNQSLEKGMKLTLKELKPEQHFTQPPAHYTEASLVKTMEELGIGRPSTYAPTITTIISRRYVSKEQKNLYVTELGEVVNNIMKQAFPSIVDVNFTATMEGLLVLCAQRGMAVWIISSGIDAICEKTDNEEFLRRLHYLNK